VFDWDEIISNEISYQLANYLKIQIFFMTAYLVLTMTYCNVFEGLPLRGNVGVMLMLKMNLFNYFYHVLWKHKARFQLCLIQDRFVKKFRHTLIGTPPSKITQEDEDFLKGK
jgi:hypothetical protein